MAFVNIFSSHYERNTKDRIYIKYQYMYVVWDFYYIYSGKGICRHWNGIVLSLGLDPNMDNVNKSDQAERVWNYEFIFIYNTSLI